MASACVRRRRTPRSLPMVPKRPTNSYFMFLKDRYGEVKSAHPGSSSRQVIRTASEIYRNLPSSSKQVYKEQANESKQEYHQEITKFRKQISPQDMQALRQCNQEKDLKKLAKKLHKPKKGACNALSAFLKAKWKSNCDEKFTETAKRLHKEWCKAPDSVKVTFERKAKDNQCRYEEKLRNWEKRMERMGYNQLVRQIYRASSRCSIKPSKSAKSSCGGSRSSIKKSRSRVSCSSSRKPKRKASSKCGKPKSSSKNRCGSKKKTVKKRTNKCSKPKPKRRC